MTSGKWLLWLSISCAAAAFGGGSGDSDADGLKDKFEQEMLERFRPQFLVPTGDCGGLPAEFAPGSVEPRSIGSNGTIYGQVFPVDGPDASKAYAEIHYYHLWAQDCGLISHPLDVERVSVLVSADKLKDKAKRWRAHSWYASAHENTVCDLGHGSLASHLNAETSGARVWISRGKHASFLTRERCGRGCGGDVCDPVMVLEPGKLINIGEPGQAMNGAVWVESVRWNFAGKMRSDFTPAVLTALARGAAGNAGRDPVVPLARRRMGAHRTIQVSSATAGALASSNRQTEGALTTATEKTERSLDRSARAVGDSLKRANLAVRRWFEARAEAMR